MKKLFLIVLLLSCISGGKSAFAKEPDLAEMQSRAVTGEMKGQFSFGIYLCKNDPDGIEKAMPWFIRADEHGDAVCEYVVAKRLIEDNMGVPAALPWFKKSAANGFFPAMNHLGELYSRKYSGVETNYAEAEHWFRKASDGGYTPASYNLGMMYLDGLGVPRDIEKATLLLQQSGIKGLNLLKSKGLIQ